VRRLIDNDYRRPSNLLVFFRQFRDFHRVLPAAQLQRNHVGDENLDFDVVESSPRG
jgi:hypothetical protein